MTANEARALSEKRAMEDNGMTKPWMDVVMKKIEAAAKAGKTSITHPFGGGYRMPGPSRDDVDRIRHHFLHLGYFWIDHSDPDPWHSGSASYTEIKW